MVGSSKPSSSSSTAEGFFTYNAQLDAFTLYHLIQEQNAPKSSTAAIGPILPALAHALAGGLASAAAKATIYPIDTIVTRMQVQKQLKGSKEAPSAASDADAEYKNPIDAARKIWKHEGGIEAFYAGVSSDVVKGIADSFLFFLAYTAVRDAMLKRQGGRQLPVVKELSVGILAGAFSKAITQPISNVVVRQQTAALMAARDPEASSSSLSSSSGNASVTAIVQQIREEKGLAGFWAGYSAQTILTLNPAITFAVDNLLKSLVPRKQRENPPAQLTFLVAALSKVVATSLTYPIMLAKSRAQASRGSSEEDNIDPHEHNYVSGSDSSSSAGTTPDRKTQAKAALRRIFRLFEGQAALYHVLRKIYRTEGVKGLYCGLDGEVVKGFLQHGLTMMLKENVHGGVIQLYYLLLKVTKRWDMELEKAQRMAREAAEGVKEAAGNAAETVGKAMG